MSDDPQIDPDALARAEAALAALGKDYLTWAESDLAALRLAIQGRDWNALHRIAHNAKGQAATFGYPLISDLGGRLCALTQAHRHPGPAQWSQAEELVDCVGQVVAHRLSGDGGEVGARLLADLP